MRLEALVHPFAWSTALVNCLRCGRPVRVSAAQFETFERMHYVCFHYEFEHDPSDPDEVCSAGGCPSGVIVGGRERVLATIQALVEECGDSPNWGNQTIADYLKALGSWIEDSDGYYLNQRRVPPSNAWETINDALQAATIYE
jgi:hypothetical protein